ncbi:hypothetical protein DFH07DRAFT_1001776 [Mycena maculata]|uniref:Uncharacterized protein n=1 Tax=Mycena maculata TaxID=230809 RepID=A0AAD7HR45_9AGAR|nr:hypothetical protein DFH07DRAFT_1001776 [Mycena maculata]
MAAKRTHRNAFNLGQPRDAPISVHLYTPSTPASAIADRIFNDPQSWNALGLTRDDIAAWDMIDQFPAVPSGPDSADFTLRPFTNKFRLSVRPDILSPESGSESESSESSTETLVNWEGVKEKDKAEEGAPCIILNVADPPKRAKDRVAHLDRMSLLWAQGNLFRAFPSPLASGCASAPTSPATDAPLGLFQRPVSSPAAHPSPTLTPRSAFKPHAHFSPLRTPNANSATWSVLEYYGVNAPETPRTARDAPASQFLRVPVHPAAPPPPPPVPTPAPAPAPTSTSGARGRGRSLAPAPSSAHARSLAPAPSSAHARSLTPTPALPSGRARSSVRPLPSIPRAAPTPVPPVPVPVLDPPVRWTRPRANTTSIRSLPPTPPPKYAPSRRPLTIPEPPLPATRHQTALSLS